MMTVLIFIDVAEKHFAQVHNISSLKVFEADKYFNCVYLQDVSYELIFWRSYLWLILLYFLPFFFSFLLWWFPWICSRRIQVTSPFKGYSQPVRNIPDVFPSFHANVNIILSVHAACRSVPGASERAHARLSRLLDVEDTEMIMSDESSKAKWLKNRQEHPGRKVRVGSLKCTTSEVF